MAKGDGKPRSEERQLKRTFAFRVSDDDHAELLSKAQKAGFVSAGYYMRTLALCPEKIEESQLRPLLGPLGRVHMRLAALSRMAECDAKCDLRDELQAVGDDIAALAQQIAQMLA